MKLLLVGLLSVFVASCASIRTASHGTVATEFTSTPPGARIEIDGNYVGVTPFTYTWPSSYQNGARFRDQVTINAYPGGAGHRQKKFYESFGGVLPPIPQKVYFDLRSPPPTDADE